MLDCLVDQAEEEPNAGGKGRERDSGEERVGEEMKKFASFAY